MINPHVSIEVLYFVKCLLPKLDSIRTPCSLYSTDVAYIVESRLGPDIADAKIHVHAGLFSH